MSSPTIYPFRQALTVALCNLVATVIAPALNASLAAQYIAQNVPNAEWVSFGADQIRIGDVPASTDPVICVASSHFDNQLIGTRTFAATYITDLILKLPDAADNSPEDFEMVQQAYVDAMLDGLTAGDGAYCLGPNLSDTIKPLPSGSNFRDCYPLGGEVFAPERLADGVTIVRKAVVHHTATVSFTLDRPDALSAD